MKPNENELSRSREDAARLRCARKGQNLSVAKACDLLGISTATLKRWESGTGTPGTQTIAKILDTWGVSGTSALRDQVRTDNFGKRAAWSIEQSGPRPVLRLIRHRRRRNRLSLEDISEATGVGLGSLQRYETGLRIPTNEILQRLTTAVGCSNLESQLLHRSLASEETPPPLELGHLFNTPNANPGFLIFRELDYVSRYHSSQTPDELGSRFRSIMLGLAFSGDYAALLEAWRDSRSFVQRSKSENPFQSLIAMAKMHLARRPKEATSDFLHIRKQILPKTRNDQDINATFSAIRMAQMLGDYEDADFMLTRLENDPNFAKVGRVSCQVYRHLLDYSLNNATDSVEGLMALQQDENPVLSYTALVAQLDIQVKMGARSAAAETLARCRHTEQTYGLGSPLARRLGASLLTA